MNQMISVIMPTYNHANYIVEAVQSVLQQTYPWLELIIVDNFSTDHTQQLIENFSDPRIRYYQFCNHGVIAASRNFGVTKSSGQWLAFIDSDDIWLENKLAQQIAYLQDKAVVAVATNFTVFGDVMYAHKTLRFSPKDIFKDLTYDDLVLESPVPTSSYLVRKADFLQVAGFDEQRDYICIEDWDLWLRLCRLGHIRVLSQPLVKYRVIRNKDRDIRTISANTLLLLKAHRQQGYLSQSLFKKASGNRCVLIAKCFLDMNDRKGLRYCYQGLRWAVGFKNKIKAIILMGLFCLPVKVKNKLVACMYCTRTIQKSHMQGKI